MPDYIKKNPVLWGILCISLLALGGLLFKRHAVEAQNKNVHITLDYREIQLLAEQSDLSLEDWLLKFKEWGAGSVAIQEESIKTLIKDGKPVRSFLIAELKAQMNWENEYPESIVENIHNRIYRDDQLIVVSDTEELNQFILSGLKERYPEQLFEVYTLDQKQYIVVKTDFDEILFKSIYKAVNVNTKEIAQVKDVHQSLFEDAGLGFAPEKIEVVKKVDLKIVPRPANYEKYPDKLVNAFINEMKLYDIKPEMIIFGGSQLVGQPTRGNDLYNYMNDNHISVALIETPVQRSHIPQTGINELTDALDYDAVRLFSIDNYIQKRFKFYNYDGSEEIEHTLYRAITERNIRLIYYKPIKWNDVLYVHDVAEYERMFDSLEKRLVDHGISIGSFSVFENNQPSWIVIGISSLGLIAASLLWLLSFVDLNKKSVYGLLAFGTLCVFGGLFVAPNTMAKLLALYSAILFPSIALTHVVFTLKKLLNQPEQSFGKILMESVLRMFVPIAIAALGGLYVGGLLSDSKYLLEMDIFRGVKLSQLMPIMIGVCVYVLSFGYMRKSEDVQKQKFYFEDLKRILMEDIKVIYVGLAGILAVVGYLYIARTGHETSIEPTDAEMIVRNFLEVSLLARPRTKEFLLAFPALVMIYSFAKQKMKVLLLPTLLVVSIGLTSIANTFSHLRTPLYLSIVRTLYSVGMGAVIGSLGVVVFYVLIKVYRKHIESYVLKWIQL